MSPQPLAIAAVTLACFPCLANTEFATHAFENLLVFDGIGPDSSHQLNVVVLDDSSGLKIASQTTVPGVHYVDGYDNCGRNLIILASDRVQVFNVRDPAHPSLAATFELENQGFNGSGWPQIIKTSDNTLLLLSNTATAELHAGEDVSRWTITNLPRTRQLQARMETESPHQAFGRSTFVSDHPAPLVLRTTERFRYELVWQRTRRSGSIFHRKYVQKVDKRTNRPVSQLLLGQHEETID